MNAFADILLSLLLGWMKGLTQLLWSFFADGGSGGFLPWLGDHWLTLVVILCIAGVAADIAAWVQRRRLAKKAGRAGDGRHASESESTWGFEQPFGDSLDMKGLAGQEEYEPRAEEADMPVFPHVERKPVRENAEKTFFPVRSAWEPRPEPDYAEEGAVPEPVAEPYIPAENRPASGETETRRRRRDKHEGQRRRLFSRVPPLIQSDEQEDGMLDGLPPMIDKNEAFHKPVYPK